MKEKKKELMFVMLMLVITMGVIFLINYLAVTFYIGKLSIFTLLVLVVPIVCIAVVAFVMGYHIKWSFGKGIIIALLLVLISFGASQVMLLMVGDKLKVEEIDVSQGEDGSGDEYLDSLYDELDKMAYEYMLEQGLISEGEEIFAGEDMFDGKSINSGSGSRVEGDIRIASSELYVGIQKSDPLTEFIGNVLTFIIALGLMFAGSKVKGKASMNMM